MPQHSMLRSIQSITQYRYVFQNKPPFITTSCHAICKIRIFDSLMSTPRKELEWQRITERAKLSKKGKGTTVKGSGTTTTKKENYQKRIWFMYLSTSLLSKIINTGHLKMISTCALNWSSKKRFSLPHVMLLIMSVDPFPHVMLFIRLFLKLLQIGLNQVYLNLWQKRSLAFGITCRLWML